MQFHEYIQSKQIKKSLEQLGWATMTNIQELAIPLLKQHHHVIMQAKTGSGKTGAYLLPILDQVNWQENHPFALIIAPTRELANQIKEECILLGKHKRIKCVSLIGKQPMNFQIQDLKQKTHVVCGTPGRILDHIRQGTLPMCNIQMVVLDEVDEICHMGFLEDIKSILNARSTQPTMCFCSATISAAVKELAEEYAVPYHICKPKDTSLKHSQLMQEGYQVSQQEKAAFLWKYLLLKQPSSAMIFCNTRATCKDVYHFLKQKLKNISILHGEMDQKERDNQMERFRNGETRWMIATDIAARGIDVEDIALIVHFEIPMEIDRFYHRNGRSGRMGQGGTTLALIDDVEMPLVKNLEMACQIQLEQKDKASIYQTKIDETKAIRQLESIQVKTKQKHTLVTEGITLLYIHAGKKQKLRPKDIVGAICQITGVTFHDIGVIQVQEYGSYVEILHDLGTLVEQELQYRPIKNKLRKVEKSRHQ